MDGEYKNAEDYRITVVKEATFGVVPPSRTRDGWVKIHKRPKKYFLTTLHFWCMNPAVVCRIQLLEYTSTDYSSDFQKLPLKAQED